MNNITIISDYTQFKTSISEPDKLTVACFNKSCTVTNQQFAAEFEAIANQYCDSARFLKVDVDDCEMIASDYNIGSTPAVALFKAGASLGPVPANKEALSRELERHLKT